MNTSTLAKTGAGVLMAAMIAAAAVKGVPYLKGEEGMVLKTAPDIVAVQTYCYGDTLYAVAGKVYTKKECDLLLDRRFVEYATEVWQALNAQAQAALTPARLIAFTSHAYHFGVAAFKASTILRLANAGDVRGSCGHFDDWVMIKTQRGGLADRRDRTGGLTANIDGKKDCTIAANKCAGIADRSQREKNMCLEGVTP